MVEQQELRRYFYVLLRWWWLILVCAALGGGAAYAVGARAAPRYAASATLLVHQAASGGTTEYTALLTSERLARTYSQMVVGRPVMEAVIGQLALHESPASLARRVEVELVRDTQLIRLRVEHTDPALAARIANAVAGAFVAESRALQQERYVESLANARAQIDEAARAVQEAQARIEAMGSPATPKEQAELAQWQTELTVQRDTYAALVQSYEQISVAAAQSADNVLLYEPAEVPRVPVGPNTMRNTALAAAVGAMIAVGVAFTIEYLDDTIKTPDDVRRALGLETLGVIGRIGEGQEELVVVGDARSPVAEAFRALRTNIRFAAVDAPLRTLLVTSPTVTEGKSFTVANLAASMAEADLRVVAVDADLRRPRQHRIFHIEHAGGLTGALLAGQLDGNVCAAHYEGRLALLTAGERPPNPAEMLGSQRMAGLLAKLQERADVVLVDSPPVLPVADAAVLAPQVDGVLLVVEAGRTRRGAAQRAVEGLHKVGANVIGAVINGVPRGRGAYYYYYYYADGYPGEDGVGPLRRRRRRGPVSAVRHALRKTRGRARSREERQRG
jgi:non-specific protein-tyrosine kinase